MRSFDLESSTDEELLRAFVESDDRDAVTALLRRHEARVYGLAYRLLGNRADAADAMQEAFIHVVRKAKSFKHQSAFSTWLYRIVANACHDLRRARERRRESPQVEVEAVEPRADQAEGTATRVDVERALAMIAQDFREAVLMRDFIGMAYQEISEALSVPIGTVKSRVARGRLALAGLLGNSNAETDRLTGDSK